MLLYSHNTPEILVASFRTKDQVKNSNLCGLIDDNLPDDLSTLKGDQLIIKEGENTINIDFALALAFNSIRSISSAVQFGKILIANGARVDVKTINFYVAKIKNGPFGEEMVDYFNNHFNYIEGAYIGKKIPFQNYLGVNTTVNNVYVDGEDIIDEDFITTIKNIGRDCLFAPGNYFSHGGSFGFLANASQTLNHTTSPKTDVTNDKGIGFSSVETFNKMPPLFQGVSTKLNQLASTTHNLFYHSFVGGVTAVPTTRADTRGHVLTPDTTTYENYSKAQSNVLNKVATYLGDLFRLDDFRKRYNPFDSSLNMEQSAPPGISGMPVGIKIQKNQSLDAIPAPGPITSFTADVVYYSPKKQGLNPLYTIEEYLADTEGKIPFVCCTTDDTTFVQGTILTSELFVNTTTDKPIPFKIIPTDRLAYSGKGPGNGSSAKIGIASSRGGISGPKGVKFDVAGGVNAMITDGGVKQPNPNDCNGIVNNGNHDMSTGNTTGAPSPASNPPPDTSGVSFAGKPNSQPVIRGREVAVDFDGPGQIHPDRVITGYNSKDQPMVGQETLRNKQGNPLNLNGDVVPFIVNNLVPSNYPGAKPYKNGYYLFRLGDYVTVCCEETQKCVRMIVGDSGPLLNTTSGIVEVSFAAITALGLELNTSKKTGGYADSVKKYWDPNKPGKNKNRPYRLNVYNS